MFRSGESSSPTRKGALSIGRIPTNRDVVRAGGSRRRLRAGRPPYSGHRWERHSRTRQRLPLNAGSISPGVVRFPNAPQHPSTRIGPKRDIGSRQIRAHGIIHVARITAKHEVTPVRKRKVARVVNVAAEVFCATLHGVGSPHSATRRGRAGTSRAGLAWVLRAPDWRGYFARRIGVGPDTRERLRTGQARSMPAGPSYGTICT